MTTVEWNANALDDLDTITDYIAQDNPIAALDLANLLLDSAEKLGYFPYIGRTGRVFGTRELIAHPNYIIIYRVHSIVEITAVVHARKQYP